MAISTTIIPPSPLEARVLDACKALLSRGVYPSVREIRQEIGRGGEQDLCRARRRLVASGQLQLPPPPRTGKGRGSLMAGSESDRRRVAARIRVTRLIWAKAGKLRTPLHIVNPGPYRLEDCRGRLLTHLILKATRRTSRA